MIQYIHILHNRWLYGFGNISYEIFMPQIDSEFAENPNVRHSKIAVGTFQRNEIKFHRRMQFSITCAAEFKLVRFHILHILYNKHCIAQKRIYFYLFDGAPLFPITYTKQTRHSSVSYYSQTPLA